MQNMIFDQILKKKKKRQDIFCSIFGTTGESEYELAIRYLGSVNLVE